MKKISDRTGNESGFTMIEMMVVLIIIAVLIAGGVTFYSGYVENSKITKAKSQITVMQGAMDTWYAEKAVYPETADLLVSAGIATGTKDPWGKEYSINLTGDKASYTIDSGYEKVHNVNTQIVRGAGTEGNSTAPLLVLKTT
jgi:general secretion pathway protein G